jgi:antitoxin HicB
MNKDLNYYMNLNYPVEVYRIPDDEGGGYSASIPQLGRFAFLADGESPEEALNNLEEVKKDLFEDYLARDITIFEPILADEEDYSGKFIVRIPKQLHRQIATRAKQESISLNQYVTHLLSTAVVTDLYYTILESAMGKLWSSIDLARGIDFKIERYDTTQEESVKYLSELEQDYAKAG